uniref:Uncharacterized protein n=1 Tax=Lactuca sativa TaxID=4236 RepID=A0A9R1XK87_LACSA|nr:hypothetical protein LSAT_V11C300126830 [Lactuca sativa]
MWKTCGFWSLFHHVVGKILTLVVNHFRVQFKHLSCADSLFLNVIIEMNIQKKFVFKPTTLNVKSLPFPNSKYVAVKFAMIVMSSKLLHSRSFDYHTHCHRKTLFVLYFSDLLKDQVDYDNFHLELFASTT